MMFFFIFSKNSIVVSADFVIIHFNLLHNIIIIIIKLSYKTILIYTNVKKQIIIYYTLLLLKHYTIYIFRNRLAFSVVTLHYYRYYAALSLCSEQIEPRYIYFYLYKALLWNMFGYDFCDTNGKGVCRVRTL